MIWIVLLAIALVGLALFPAFQEWLRPQDDAPLGIDDLYPSDWHKIARHKVSGDTPTHAEEDEASMGAEIHALTDVRKLPRNAEPRLLRAAFSDSRIVVSNTSLAVIGQRIDRLKVRGNLSLAGGTSTDRWIHASGVVSCDGTSRFMGSVTAGRSIKLENGTRFERLEAPEIRTGSERIATPKPSPDFSDHIAEFGTLIRKAGKMWILSGDVFIPENHRVTSNLLILGQLHVGKGSVIAGDVKAHESIILAEGAGIEGNLFSREDILLTGSNLITGVLLSEASLRIGAGSVIGHPDQPVTVSAPQVTLSHHTKISGCVLAQHAGSVIWEDDWTESTISTPNNPVRHVA